jgi:hypothetical protein
MKDDDSLNAQIEAKVNRLMIDRLREDLQKLTNNTDILVKTVSDLVTTIKVQDEKNKFNEESQQNMNESISSRLEVLEKYVEMARLEDARNFLMHQWLSKNWIKIALVMGSIIGVEGIQHLNIF